MKLFSPRYLLVSALTLSPLSGASKTPQPPPTPRQQVRQQMLSNLDSSWKIQAHADPTPVDTESLDSKRLQIQGALKKIQIPEITLARTPLDRVIPLLNQLARQYAPDPKAPPINFVLLDPSHQNPPVSIDLKQVSLLRVLELVTTSLDYSFDVEEDAILIRSPGTPQNQRLETRFFPIARATVIRLLGVPSEQAIPSASPKDSNPPVDKTTPKLSQKEEESELRQFFQRAGVDFKIAGTSLAFAGTQLIVTQTARNLERLKNLLAHYVETKQVEIEAKFLEVQQGTLEELGVRWHANTVAPRTNHNAILQTSDSAATNNDLRQLSNAFNQQGVNSAGSITIASSGSSTSTAAAQTIAIPTQVPQMPNDINVGAQTVPVGSFLGVLDGISVNAVINALEQHTGSDLMSAPKLTVLSGKTAKIVVAQELRYPKRYGDTHSDVGSTGTDNSAAGVTITAGTPLDFETRNIGVEMEVTPTVEENNSVNLRLEPCVTEFEGFVEYGGTSVAISNNTTVRLPSGFIQPIFSTRQIRTEVNIFDGATVVMGGLTREEVKEVQDAVPFLSKIPILGNLFRSKGETTLKKNLLIFVTANVVAPNGYPIRQKTLAGGPTK